MAEMTFDGQRDGEDRTDVSEAFFDDVAGMGDFTTVCWGRIYSDGGAAGEQVWFFVWLGCLILGMLFALNVWMKWYFSYYLITNERVRQVQQRGIFRKTVVDLGLDKIQSIKYDVPGIFSGMLGYGTILIRTQVGNMTISMVKKPEKIYNVLQDLASKVAK